MTTLSQTDQTPAATHWLRALTEKLPRPNLADTGRQLLLPIIGILLFLGFWHLAAPQVQTSLGAFPGPGAVLEQSGQLWQEHSDQRERASQFITMQEQRNERILAENPVAEVKIRSYPGAPTFIDQVVTSLGTVLAGFVLATLIAVPLGIVIGLNRHFSAAVNPLIQIFKPVSPLAWLPLVTMVVSATYVSDDPLFEKSFVTSMITVTLCSLWPTLINTSVGVAAVNPDLLNVSKVLRLSFWTHVRKVVLPSSVPMIFTGLRVSLGIAWMVLIAAEMLAQSPGLGKFVWDEFQNGSSQSLSRIMVAVLAIGFIGFLLDRIMLLIQKKVAWNE
ncbi:binding-protein-dependent transport system inner membrane protein [Marinobacter lipolyticus SM19]|uniref:Binding-protein-dependent transport system inner membrane protein n=1 Tax=Marinobacter lipolyticus SM19 TaxID=1318628 RepID=R8B0V2_9GAMM|nr:ABC transporter permease [Marinobacter lipolyticus]EON92210.1 binding-protein-dependent transport system inner membrane protein [Marinobacter lipolyticus SM19]